jgi:hypothetical protein
MKNDLNPKEIRKYSERILRSYHSGKYACAPPISKKPCHETVGDISKKIRSKENQLPKITVVEIDEPLFRLNLEAQEQLTRRAV